MRFQYDPAKVTVEDPDAEGERRFVTIGIGSAGELLVIVYTDRGDDCRIIPARRATKRERRSYEG